MTAMPDHFPLPPLTTVLAMARNQPGQNGGNQGPIFSAHIAVLSTHEIKDPSKALASSNRERLMHALYRENSHLSLSEK